MSLDLGEIDGLSQDKIRRGVWVLDDTDFWLSAMLQDPVYGPELLWPDPNNLEYGGCYRVRDYQYPLNRRTPGKNYSMKACARTVGKTESIKAKAFTHAFRRHGTNLLLTAPELIHLLPLTDAVESRIRDCILTASFLDTRNGQTGFTHRPFGVKFFDNTQIIGRIPRLSGTGVKGQHQPDLIVDEGQDYPANGWTEVHETVMKDVTDADGNPDFWYEVYGVHSGDRSSRFYALAREGAFEVTQITAIQRPGWGTAEKESAKAMYGGVQGPDYRRNILGEPGAAASALFVLARLSVCTDQIRSSEYNTIGYKHILMQAEEFDEYGLPMSDYLDLPGGYKELWAGADLGLTNHPTVISIFAHSMENVVRGDKVTAEKRERLKLVRRITMYRFRARQIVDAWLAIGDRYGDSLQGFGVDATGLGFPIVQAMEDDQKAGAHLAEVTRGYFFNSKVPVHVNPENIVYGQNGEMKDQYGSAVKEDVDPLTGDKRFVTYMPMIEASTRYLREMVDSTFLLLPFDQEVAKDMMGETVQRVKAVGEMRRKPVSFHTLDSFRAMAMVYRREDVELALAPPMPPVLDIAVMPGTMQPQEMGQQLIGFDSGFM